jgi:hypothetical protein
VIIIDGQQLGEGWRPDLAIEAVPKLVEAQRIRPLAAFLPVRDDRPAKVDFTVYLEKVWGPNWYLNQQECGSCVAFGAALACDALMAIDIVRNGKRKPSTRTEPMSIYWGSRVEIGGGRISGEGSVGAWAAEYLKKFGALETKEYEAIDLRRYSPAVCCGPLSRRGVPDDLEPVARKHPVKAYAQVKTFDEAVTSLAAGYPVTVASDQGFRFNLDRNGFATASGTWMHQMCIVGYELTPTPSLLIANSWGACYTGGPDGWCPAVKKIRKSTAERMLRQGDSWALSDFINFAPKGIDWDRLNF